MMEHTSLFIYIIGFIAQGFFSARMLIQWVMSERSHRVVSPLVYWLCSLAGSVLLFVYGYFRHDFAILLGQFISYYIYIWNLDIKGFWKNLILPLRILLMALPVAAIVFMMCNLGIFVHSFLNNSHVPLWLLLYGSAGQVIFSVRFLYQWYYSYRIRMSVLPVGFWIISLVGCFVIVSYGIFRLDPVLILGQSVGFITYSRNIVIIRKQKMIAE
jgi:lipid-A-disaccharide synthase-like uncharacterized protein